MPDFNMLTTDQPTKRVRIIPFLHGKFTRDGKLSEPDIYFILEKWLDRHPQFKGREQDIRITRGRHTLPGRVSTELVCASMAFCDALANYKPVEDADLYEYYLAEEQA
jgi:hypothetical protein